MAESNRKKREATERAREEEDHYENIITLTNTSTSCDVNSTETPLMPSNKRCRVVTNHKEDGRVQELGNNDTSLTGGSDIPLLNYDIGEVVTQTAKDIPLPNDSDEESTLSNDPEVQVKPWEERSLREILQSIGKGDFPPPHITLAEHNDIKHAKREFNRKIDEYINSMYYCKKCHRRKPGSKSNTGDQCKDCAKDLKNQSCKLSGSKKGIRRFTLENEMDPQTNVLTVTDGLPPLNQIEEMAIVRVHPFFAVYYLPNGTNAYKGGVINVMLNSQALDAQLAASATLPLSIKKLPALVLQKPDQNEPSG